jgi:cystathionine gamma-synthase
MTAKTSAGQSTLSIWGGEQEHELYERSTQVPVVHSVSFTYRDIDTWHDVALEKAPGRIYSRNTNPTVRAFEDKVRELEDAEAATSFASGMAAISNVLSTFLGPGDRVVSIKDSYGGTNKIFNDHLPPLNIEVCLCETIDYE